MYSIEIGVYSPETGARQTVRVGSQVMPDDRIVIGQVRVE
jgi:hypothetical protein